MKKRKKLSILCIVLSFVFLLSMIPVPVIAIPDELESNECQDCYPPFPGLSDLNVPIIRENFGVGDMVIIPFHDSLHLDFQFPICNDCCDITFQIPSELDILTLEVGDIITVPIYDIKLSYYPEESDFETLRFCCPTGGMIIPVRENLISRGLHFVGPSWCGGRVFQCVRHTYNQSNRCSNCWNVLYWSTITVSGCGGFIVEPAPPPVCHTCGRPNCPGCIWLR